MSSLFDLTSMIAQSCAEQVANLHAQAQQGRNTAPLAIGLRRSARLPILVAFHTALQAPVVLVTDRADRALALSEELSLWAPGAHVMIFSEPAPLFYEQASWGEATRRERLLVLTRLATYHIPGNSQPSTPPIIIVPARGLMTRTLPRREYLKATRTLKRGQAVALDDLVRTCVTLGYEPAQMVISTGQFARRGGILDIWPPAEALPVRLEFFGDEIETMRRFDPGTQRTLTTFTSNEPGNSASSLAQLDRVVVSPAREYLLKPETSQISSNQEISEFHIPLLHSTPASLLDYLPRQAIVFIDDRQALEDIVHEIEEQAVTLRRDSLREGTLSENFPIPYLTWPDILDGLITRTCLELGPSSAIETEVGGSENQAAELAHSTQPGYTALSARFTAGQRFGGRLKTVMEHVVGRHLAGERVVIVSRQAARLQELWQESYLQKNEKAAPVFVEGSLSEGWVFRACDGSVTHLLTDGEIFGWRRPEPRRRPQAVAEAPETGYLDLQVGDWVVHVDHGIGRYQGLVQRTMEGAEREYLCIEYANDAQIFVPVHQADRLTRYVGPDSRTPTPSALGGSEWRSAKSEVKEAVKHVAEDLLELYARRSVSQGYRFGPDNAWQGELEASFPYIETDDQMRVLAEVKADMESPRPMDRLICGDVGYGKTEIALRAAFKAVLEGKQVAILVPTTVLAQQHYNTFQQRLAAFPVQVEMLSRFRTPQQQRAILDRLSKGQVDIVIGTHRLLSADVQFHDLGLLIIDEEQRFGVTHKEALKKLRTEVDILTLSATPIPRTLYLALSGVRDISMINTPPEERLPVVTHVGPYSPRLARQAILRELERGGQVFFVHNRVQTIEAMRKHINQLVPEARLAIAHGQMPEHELAERMQQFTEGEIDVLLCTSIIESGLDIPNANTLIIDRADTFGLAQLYQLRGRVGRGAQRAYAYFFRHNRIAPTPEGRMRLETIAENTQLGAGFSIAMRDLEIRGAGEVLGFRQHGHIAAVGFHLYTSLLAEAVRRLRVERGLPAVPLPTTLNLQLTPVNVELPISSSIPSDYVTDKNVRLGLYRRMADMRSLDELDALQEEFEDRFGALPDATQNLFFQLKVKLLAEKAGLASITVESGQFALRFPEGGVPANLPEVPLVRVGKMALWMPYTGVEDWPARLMTVLQSLAKTNVAGRAAMLAGHPQPVITSQAGVAG